MISNISESDDTLSFTLAGVNFSLANALRRTILSDIPVVVFITFPYELNKANIIKNTSRFNNEIIKQRLSCIPIHISDLETPLQHYLVEINVENDTNSIIFVTTQDFKIKNIELDTYLSEEDTKHIFPSNSKTGQYIDFVRLRPKISEDLLGEKLQMTAEMSISTAADNSMYNVVSTCSYGYTVDLAEIERQIELKRKVLKEEGKTKEDIDFEIKNWRLLQGERITIKDSFDFVIESIGIYSNVDIVIKACDILIIKIENFRSLLKDDKLDISKSISTMKNSFDIVSNEGYTLGKMIEYYMITFFYSLGSNNTPQFVEDKITYCTFDKFHPHDTTTTLRIAYNHDVLIDEIKHDIELCLNSILEVYGNIKEKFTKK
jgi:DNA-directed RNA polymerase alpha subunit